MSRLPENDNIRNDIYENLPCQAMYNQSVHKIKQQSITITQANLQTQNAATVPTPLSIVANNDLNSSLLLNNSNNQQQPSLNNSASAIVASSNNTVAINSNNAKKINLSKELLYATPLRKSDRFKSNNDSTSRSNNSNNSNSNNSNINNSISNNSNNRFITNNHNYQQQHHNQQQQQYHNQQQLNRINNDDINNIKRQNNDKLTNTEYKLINKENNSFITKNSCTTNNISNSNNGRISPSLIAAASGKTNNDIATNSFEERRILSFLKDTTQCQKKLDMISSGKDCPNSSFSCLAREEHFANLVQQNFHQIDTNAITTDSQKFNSITTQSKDISTTVLSIADETAKLIDESVKNFHSQSQKQQNILQTDHLNSFGVTQDSTDNIEILMDKKLSPDKEVNGFIVSSTPSTASNNATIVVAASANPLPIRHSSNVYINREWVLKKIALCLEQRTTGKKSNTSAKLELSVKESSVSASSFLPRPPTGNSSGISSAGIGGSTSTYHGCLVLGSNGSGKTAICQAIMNGNSGTKGILNRKLLACYLINSQNPDCHSLSLFIRSIVLQILSHSSVISKDDIGKVFDETFGQTGENISNSFNEDLNIQTQHAQTKNKNGNDNNLNRSQQNNSNLEEELLIAELKLSGELDEFAATKPSSEKNKESKDDVNSRKVVQRQKSAPSPEKISVDGEECENAECVTKNSYGTHPPKANKINKGEKIKESDREKQIQDQDKSVSNLKEFGKAEDGRSNSSITMTSVNSNGQANPTKSANNTTIQQGGGEDIADVLGDELKNEIEAEINDDSAAEANKDLSKTAESPTESASKDIIETEKLHQINNDDYSTELEKNSETNSQTESERYQPKESPKESLAPLASLLCSGGAQIKSATGTIIPPPLPKPKSCRTVIADSYYEMLISNPEIFECLNVDNIEKNPDECFKKALLFPLLELTPPRTALLMLIDSIDENYINEGNLISTLKGRTMTQKSRNIAELLSNHIHLFPKWLFLVCTTKKQTKHITKMFTGFKKITLDDLRKSHVVKDVQEYIINRLNSDFKGTINLTKEIIESLHQLYIKSNGCILYLEKVLNGIKDNFFSFREIKLIPCTLNGLYLYICQKSFNKKQYSKVRPILNILLASTGFVDRLFLFNCLRAQNYTIDFGEFEKRLELMKNILIHDGLKNSKIKLFHNSFADWLVDVKFATKKFICNVNEGHVLISMYYMLVSDILCANSVRRFCYHLIKSGDYLTSKNINMDLILMLLESRINLSDCFYTNALNCCSICENEYRNDPNFLPKTKEMIRKFLNNELNNDFSVFLCDFFKPSLPTDPKTLKLLIETGINNAESQASCDSSLISPELSEKSTNIDFELADLLLSSEKACLEEIQRPKSSSDKSDQRNAESQDDNTSTLHQLSDSHRIEMHKGKALIHILANDGNAHLLERALKACKGPIDLEIEDYNGQTALNIAARNGHLDVVKLLLHFTQPLNDGTGRMKRVDVNHADRDGWTPLRSASWGGHTEVVKLLIAHPGCSIDLADKEGRTALRAAAWSGHEDILKILIEAGADVNSVDRQGRTSLIAASYMGHYDIVEILLESGANVNHLDLDGRSALCVAALCGSSGYSKVISTLLEHGAHTDQLDNDGMSPLLVSSFEGNSEVCELLLENGADPDLADFMGRTPLWAACTAGHANVVKLLLFWGCGIDCMDAEGRTVLSIAAAQGNVETVRQLLDRGLDETHRDNAGWTPLHYAAFEGFHEVCVQILESGAKIDECDNEGKTALHLAAQEGRQKCIQALLEIHDTFMDQKAHDGKTAFRLACLEGHVDCIQTLLKFGCDVNSKDADSRTTLYILALENKLDVVKYLLDVTEVDVNIPDSEGRTALHVAAWQGHAEMVKLLITLGNANVNAMDLECRTPLHSCAWQGNHDVMTILLYFGAIPDHACKQGATALGISAQEGHDKCVAILLKYGANPYKSDHCGRTPIKLAAKSNRNNILKIFETFAKNETNIEHQKIHPNMLRSPDQPQAPPFLTNQMAHMLPNNNNAPPTNVLNASNSTHSSNFYENTMQSDNSSLQKRKSVISSQSTGSSNDAPLSFTQQLQRHTKMNSRNNPFIQNTPIVNTKYPKGQQRHSQMLADLNEYQMNIAPNVQSNDADMFDMECMSPLYATPPHSPSSDLSSPGQLPQNHVFEEIGGNHIGLGNGLAATHNIGSSQKNASSTDNHFARDTHMRIILGNCKDSNNSANKSKRSGIATNPAMRLIRSRFDSAANLIRRTNNMLSSNNQGSSSIGVKSGTFQWRKESQM
ncbi:uncharacterized protein LOC129614395 isoform X2 [Condylostylus longicornis]|uniref:uncharacterized protein LOC129614395 isoform X2 n=1 Tax=Condylostylus longicornis TaxID=2530218 RepID=UPI00244DA756|nr:uncharacterized protein LOC129614395 isoform X2 [Condylostylus longicornis]